MSPARLLFLALFFIAAPGVMVQAEEIGTLGKYGVRHVTAPQAAELINTQKEIVILDVRTPGEFNDGHVDGALNIDYHGGDFAKLIHLRAREELRLIDEDTVNGLLRAGEFEEVIAGCEGMGFGGQPDARGNATLASARVKLRGKEQWA